MNREQFDLALHRLQEQDPPLILPYGASPGEEPGGGLPTFTAATWAAYRWNPPGVARYDGQPVDSGASAKPTWAMLQAALGPAELAQAQRAAIRELHNLCQRKITANYGATGPQEEIFLRLRNGETAAQNTERDRLRGMFQTQKTAINGAATTAAVESLLTAARADAFWAPPDD